ncbi:60S ribosomal protein L6 [Sorochytrium milnesiophthora]
MVKNSLIATGVTKLSKAHMKRKGLLHRHKRAAPAAKEAKPETTTKTIGGAKNGQTRVVPVKKAPKFYAGQSVSKPKVSRKAKTPKRAALRSTITPGTVLILLSGRFRGKRVVFLKQLASGLLLITGPFKVNGVPLRRVNQAYVIATSTKIDLSGLKVDDKINDAYFKSRKDEPKSNTEADFFKDAVEKKKRNPSKIADQKQVDKVILSAIAKQEHLKHYLNAKFALSKGQAPHKMKF